jgi:hypothetical protein
MEDKSDVYQVTKLSTNLMKMCDVLFRVAVQLLNRFYFKKKTLEKKRDFHWYFVKYLSPGRVSISRKFTVRINRVYHTRRKTSSLR